MGLLGNIARAVLLGLVGYSAPRLAVAMGVPLDSWIAGLASLLTATKDVISREQALWGATWVCAIAFAFVELWWHPLRRLATKLGGAPMHDADVIRAQAELEKQRRLYHKQLVSAAKPPPVPALSSSPRPTKPAIAYIHWSPGISIDDYQGENISSIADNGLGDYTITFESGLNPQTLVALPVGDTPPFKVVSYTANSVRVKFEQEPPIVRIRFDAP